jgi:sulfite reductase (NADPH) hemoprotein beta-component
MYVYNALDTGLVQERVNQFRDQVARRLGGDLSEDDFRPLRLMNGLYLQRHAYMLRVAIPYGLLNTAQVRALAHIARHYDRDYAHFTTRQNLQYNWPSLKDVPDILQVLADVEMHAIQTSGNCIRNISADHLAGIALDEIVDPRPYAEIMRQWSSFHPEFSYLPRKFKIAFTGASNDRAAIAVHDIGYRMLRNEKGEVGLQVVVGGGLGRTPIIGEVIHEFLAPEDMVSHAEAILRVYNLHGDRDNKYKARIKILVKRLGIEEFRRQVEAEWSHIKDGSLKIPSAEFDRIGSMFQPPAYLEKPTTSVALSGALASDPKFARWYEQNTADHKIDGYRIVYVSLKSRLRPPGDATADQIDAVADVAEKFSFGEVRTTHEQNLVLGDVAQDDLYDVWKKLDASDLATPNIGTITDLICCPGLDFCALANAGSIGVAAEITDVFEDFDRIHELGAVKLKMSGCINACGHHHVGHIGILGIDKNGEEYYQVMLGGSAADDASLGKWLGPAIPKDQIAGAVEKVLDFYVQNRIGGEEFLAAYRRLGREPFKEAVYGVN